jgi:hypothetical protein
MACGNQPCSVRFLLTKTLSVCDAPLSRRTPRGGGCTAVGARRLEAATAPPDQPKRSAGIVGGVSPSTPPGPRRQRGHGCSAHARRAKPAAVQWWGLPVAVVQLRRTTTTRRRIRSDATTVGSAAGACGRLGGPPQISGWSVPRCDSAFAPPAFGLERHRVLASEAAREKPRLGKAVGRMTSIASISE